MWQRNNGQGDAEKLQNRFTSYLVTAVNRRRKDYMNQRNRRLRMECYLEDKGFDELSAELGITYKGAAAIYYRTVKKIKQKMGEDINEFYRTAESGKDWK